MRIMFCVCITVVVLSGALVSLAPLPGDTADVRSQQYQQGPAGLDQHVSNAAAKGEQDASHIGTVLLRSIRIPRHPTPDIIILFYFSHLG